MRMAKWTGLLVALGMLTSCGNEELAEDLCQANFHPYPDLVPERTLNGRNALLIEGMAAYTSNDHEKAIKDFTGYLRTFEADKGTYLYLACSYLALDQPYEAELQLDHLERSNLKQFRDEAEWYTLLCWVCSGQLDRARSGAAAIAKGKQRYAKQAAALFKQLDIPPTE